MQIFVDCISFEIERPNDVHEKPLSQCKNLIQLFSLKKTRK